LGYFLGIVIVSCIYIILSLGYSFQLGQSGVFSIAHGAFYGVGAYCAAIAAVEYNVNFWLALVFGMVGAGLLSVILGVMSLRVAGDYLVVASFAFQLIVLAVIVNWPQYTKGSIGILGIERPAFIATEGSFTIFCLVIAAVTAVLCFSIVKSPFGRALRASRDDRLAAASLGKRVARSKLAIFTFTSALAGLAGGLYAYYQGFISPNSFSVSVSIVVLSMVVLGGLRSVTGAILGAIVLVALPQVIALIPMPATVLGPIQQMIYGGILVAVMIIRPQGILGGARSRFSPLNVSSPVEDAEGVPEELRASL